MKDHHFLSLTLSYFITKTSGISNFLQIIQKEKHCHLELSLKQKSHHQSKTGVKQIGNQELLETVLKNQDNGIKKGTWLSKNLRKRFTYCPNRRPTEIGYPGESVQLKDYVVTPATKNSQDLSSFMSDLKTCRSVGLAYGQMF